MRDRGALVIGITSIPVGTKMTSLLGHTQMEITVYELWQVMHWEVDGHRHAILHLHYSPSLAVGSSY